jgi:hypothetical protein
MGAVKEPQEQALALSAEPIIRPRGVQAMTGTRWQASLISISANPEPRREQFGAHAGSRGTGRRRGPFGAG